ncbi:hypothetical protein BO83DRAFT_426731 [Aspergillus eucalypticola CBS 122712]|uniref:Transcription factor domain-containing protein n=1 Tax=Aspergillus eucalypticola (strain CBS 122712 / IBT 29274) TaxID=1448314 RepID=A0A317VJG9_ASPEC|nr:uncharacterized protein BO83DRAFT_426731 [Aspergillus eucalypticola CBS 122712]PWY74075.1 hypothetical protein BO83DRAFT_426731 [Aspergillus eucalypticola CBS 122712]
MDGVSDVRDLIAIVLSQTARSGIQASETQTCSVSPKPKWRNDFIDRELLNIAEGEELLLKFRTDLMPLFPFVLIHEVNFGELREKSPFLLLCIMSACLEHKPALQQRFEFEVRSVISTRIMMNMERDMDILRGLLVHIAWSHYHWRNYHTQVYMLLQMAMAIVVDLGLDRYDNLRMRHIYDHGEDMEGSQREQVLCLTPDGQRAFLGCYYLCSKASIFRRQLNMKYTDWVNHCAECLGQRAEYPSDQYIKALIEIQLLARKSELELENPAHATNNDELFQSIDVLENKIEQLFVQNKKCNTWALRLELNATPAIVLGHALSQRDRHHQYNQRRLLRIARSAFNIVTVFLATPTSVTPNLPMFSYTSIWYGLLVLSKLSLLSDAAKEDNSLEVHSRDIHNLGLAAMQKMETISRGKDVWDNCRAVIGSMLSWLEKSRTKSKEIQLHKESSRKQEVENPDLLPEPVPEDSPLVTVSAVTEDWDATVWHQMLQDLTWIGGIPVEQQSAVHSFQGP